MAGPEDKKDVKRAQPAPKAEGPRKREGRAKGASDATPPAVSRKGAAAPSTRKAAKPAGPRPSTRRPAAPSAEKPAAARRGAARPATARPAAPKPAKPKAPAAKSAKPAAAKPAAAKPAAPRKRAAARKPDARGGQPAAPPALDEEQRIEDAKYLPRDLPRRLFEEERFIFPDSYGQSRIRLLVKDPDWLFAHWDVDPQSLADLRAELGERASALSSLTLRVSDPQHGGESRVLLPDGARSWYVRADTTQRSYRAELGLTLPSGEFRSLARSNTVTTPRTGPARTGGPRRMRYDGATPPAPGTATPPRATVPAASAAPADPGPWRPDPSTPSHPGPGGSGADRPAEGLRKGRPGEPSGGASDVYRR